MKFFEEQTKQLTPEIYNLLISKIKYKSLKAKDILFHYG